MTQYLDFEKPLADLEGKAEELRAMAEDDASVQTEADALDEKAKARLEALYAKLTPWQKCLVARHPERPHCGQYIRELFTEYTITPNQPLLP